jgi:spoIIIJ-associated protein
MVEESKPQAVESRGSTVEAAIEAGLTRLGMIRGEVDIEILDEGSRGILGIGSRDAVVRLTPRLSTTSTHLPQATTPPPPAPTRPTPSKEEAEPIVAVEDDEAVPFLQVVTPQPAVPAPTVDDAVSDDEDGQPEVDTDEDSVTYLEQERDAAVLILNELLDKMQVRATVTTRLSELDEITGRRVNLLDVTGDDLGVLIGPRGDTLDALQYVARLMVSHRLHRRVNFLVDVEGYRERREQALVRLAERMADKVRQRQEPISLEPMPPYERRIIHMTLRNASGVYTESTGEGDRRKVRIYPQ